MAMDDNAKNPPQNDLSRRDLLKGAGALAAAVGISAVDPTPAQAQGAPAQPVNPYGGGPGTGLQFPALLQANAVGPHADELFPGQ